MGLDLKPLITAVPIKLAELSGKVVAVDAFNTIYQFLSTIRGPTGEPLMNGRGEITSHLSGMFYRNVNLLMENIRPVYVFDGKMHPLKAREIERRYKVKQEAVAMYNQALEEGRMEDAVKYGKRTSVLTDEMIGECKKLLDALGIPYVQAPSDGEAAAAYLTKTGVAYASASQDYDSILFGAKRLVHNMAVSGKRKIPGKTGYVDVEPEMIEHDNVLKETGLTHEQLVDVGILIGTDFNPDGFAGIGPKTAIKLIRESGRLENVGKVKQELASVPYQEIRDIFLKPEVPSTADVRFGEVSREKVLDFLCVQKSFSADRVAGTLDRLQKAQDSRSQSLEKWFG
jgi:flap endonuclease-1